VYDYRCSTISSRIYKPFRNYLCWQWHQRWLEKLEKYFCRYGVTPHPIYKDTWPELCALAEQRHTTQYQKEKFSTT
jgi:hypothetical protein